MLNPFISVFYSILLSVVVIFEWFVLLDSYIVELFFLLHIGIIFAEIFFVKLKGLEVSNVLIKSGFRVLKKPALDLTRIIFLIYIIFISDLNVMVVALLLLNEVLVRLHFILLTVFRKLAKTGLFLSIQDRKNFYNRLHGVYNEKIEGVLRAGLLIQFLVYFWAAYQLSILLLTVVSVLTLWMLSYFQYAFKNIKPLLAFNYSMSAIEDIQPQVLIYCSGAKNSAYQVNQWLSVLERQDLSILVIVREAHYLNDIIETTLPIYYCRSVSDIDNVVVESVKCVLYPANGNKNAQMLRKSELKHIFINHGESDKAVNVSKFLLTYDCLFLAGEMAYQRLESAGLTIDENRIRYVGRPQLDISLKIVTNELEHNRRLSVLYAPTWEGFNDSVNYCSISMEMVNEIEKLLKNGFDVHFKPHPYTGMRVGKLKIHLKQVLSFSNRYENFHFYESEDIHVLMNCSDILLCDISSVLNDYLYTEKPIVLTKPVFHTAVSFASEFPSSNACYLYDSNDSLSELLISVTQNDVKRNDRLYLKKYSLGKHKVNSFTSFKESLEEFAK